MSKNPGMGHVQTSKVIPADSNALYAFLADLQNVSELLGGRLAVEFPRTPPQTRAQAEFEVMLTRFHVTVRVIARVEEAVPGERIAYRQISGFFRQWHHLMLIREHGPGQSVLTDIVEFKMPGGLLGSLADDLIVKGDLTRLLEFRATKIAEHFERGRASSAPDGAGIVR